MKQYLLPILLSLYLPTWCSQAPDKKTVAAKLTPPAATTAVAKLVTLRPTDEFEKVKQLLQKTPWTYIEEGKKTTITHCGESARTLVRLVHNKTIDTSFVEGILDKPLTEFNGHNPGAIIYDEKFYIHPFFNTLLDTTPSKQEHLTFFIVLRLAPHNYRNSYHVLAVEKFYDGIHEPWWRVYQSWHRGFTLQQWLGLTPTTHLPKLVQNMITSHGKGKQLTELEIMDFFRVMANNNTLYYHYTQYEW